MRRENGSCVLFFRLLAERIINIHLAAFKHKQLLNDQTWATAYKTEVLVWPYRHFYHLQSKSSHLHMRECPAREKMLGDH